MKLRTQKAQAAYNGLGEFHAAYSAGNVHAPHTADTPVLVVPEAAVKGCKHENEVVGGFLRCCADCGSWSGWDDYDGKWLRWQRPRILRAGRRR